MRRLGVAVGLAALTAGLLSSTGPAVSGAPLGWAPAPATIDGLSVLAESDAQGFRLHTTSGDKTFLPGINLGSTTPLHQPGEVGTIPQSQFHTWLQQMGDLGIRVVRVYTLLPPGFYTELHAYNVAHPTAPIYLFQGAYLPDESYAEEGHTLYDTSVDTAFTQEIHDISDAVHGDFYRAPPAEGQPAGRSYGLYDADVSPWLAGWIIGVEWDQFGIQRTDQQDANAPYTPGQYFAATSDASASERWIAEHMDQLAGYEAARGDSEPIAMANWPTTDPLDHGGYEPNPTEDGISVDANHVLPTSAWPAGTFASFHLYPYYPDFQRYEPAYQDVMWNGRPDPYAGYIKAMQAHFAGHMPLLVTEFGVPASLGNAHFGPLGRDQGDHTEQQMMSMDADMMRMLQAEGTGGGFVFIWEDEWFKKTWNTYYHQVPDRRQLWHDPLTNEQWFGLMATDPDPIDSTSVDKTLRKGPIKYLYNWADASYVHMDVAFRKSLPKSFQIDADVLSQLAGPDYRIVVNLRKNRADTYVRRELDPIRLDTSESPYRPGESKAWHLYSLLTNRTYTLKGVDHPAQYYDVGHLVRGNWDPQGPKYNSLSTWRPDPKYLTVHLRIPWSMLGLADPSSRTALGPGNPADMVTVPGIDFTYVAGDHRATLPYRWHTWNNASYTQRPKAGIGMVEKAFRDLAP